VPADAPWKTVKDLVEDAGGGRGSLLRRPALRPSRTDGDVPARGGDWIATDSGWRWMMNAILGGHAKVVMSTTRWWRRT
jgi:hypothetical protein